MKTLIFSEEVGVGSLRVVFACDKEINHLSKNTREKREEKRMTDQAVLLLRNQLRGASFFSSFFCFVFLSLSLSLSLSLFDDDDDDDDYDVDDDDD